MVICYEHILSFRISQIVFYYTLHTLTLNSIQSYMLLTMLPRVRLLYYGQGLYYPSLLKVKSTQVSTKVGFAEPPFSNDRETDPQPPNCDSS